MVFSLGKKGRERSGLFSTCPMNLLVEQSPLISAEGGGRRKIPGAEGVYSVQPCLELRRHRRHIHEAVWAVCC